MTVTESDRLLAEGRTLTLRRAGEERTVTVRYDMRGVKYLEDYFGSLKAAGRAVDSLFTPGGDDNKIIEVTIQLLHAGIHREMTLDEVWEWTEVRHIADYCFAILLAITEAMPSAKGTSPNGRAGSDPSRGVKPGRRRSSRAVAATSSGA